MTERYFIDPHLIESAWIDASGELKLNVRASLNLLAKSETDCLQYRRSEPTHQELLRLAAQIYDRRRERNRLFTKEKIFGEPAWDMLLALYCFARGKENFLTVTSLSAAAELKPTTGLRWQQTLIYLGLMERGSATKDNRCVYVRLTDEGRNILENYLKRVATNEYRQAVERSIFRFSDSASEAK